MSMHWNPDDDLARCIAAEEAGRPRKASWPEGATAGLMLVAACCLLVGGAMYRFAGPRDVIEDGVARR